MTQNTGQCEYAKAQPCLETAEVRQLPERLVFNCTGLGAKALFNDDELTPVEGQLTFLLPQPEVEYSVVPESLYMFSRHDGIVLGGTHDEGSGHWTWTTRCGTRSSPSTKSSLRGCGRLEQISQCGNGNHIASSPRSDRNRDRCRRCLRRSSFSSDAAVEAGK